MEKVRQIIGEALKDAKSPALLCSFGKDSLLLLILALQINPDIAIIWFKHRANREQRRFAEKIISAFDLTVLSYSPADSYFVPNEDSLTLIDEMSFGANFLPLLTDTKQGESCAIKLKGERTQSFNYTFDVTLFGYKKSDAHPAVKTTFANDFHVGNTRFIAPLYDLTDGEVLRALESFSIPYEEIDDSLSVCTNCLTSDEPVYCPEVQSIINPVIWDRGFALDTFKQRFNKVETIKVAG